MQNSQLARSVLCGNLDNIPEVPSACIRIFFSSTFTDMSVERNLLMKTVIPELKTFCSDRSFEFEVVDMRWGIRESATADHTITEICLKEIGKCQDYSQGPNYVLFVGDKYGARPLPSHIPVTEFRLFRRIASWLDIKFETVEKWYVLDRNAVPVTFSMLPITDLLPYYNNMNPVHEMKRKIHEDNWESDERNMKSALRKVATVALDQELITAEACEKYFISVTEFEIKKGLLEYPHVDKTLCFQRTLTNINNEDSMAKRFTDLTNDGNSDEEARELREKLRREKIPEAVPAHMMLENTVAWTPKGVDPENPEHAAYLESLVNAFQVMIMKQISTAMKKVEEVRNKHAMMAESIAHMKFNKIRTNCYFGQEETFKVIYNAVHCIQDPQEEQVGEIEGGENVGGENKDAENKDGEDDKTEEVPEGEKAEGEREDNKRMERIDETEEEHRIAEQVEAEFDENVDETQEDEEEKAEGDEEEEEEEAEPEMSASEKMQAEMQSLKEHYKRLGDRAPTFSAGYNDQELGSTGLPKDAKEELIKVTMTETVHKPVVIYGESGSGMTSLMARMAEMIKVYKPNCVLISRFVGKTLKTRNVRNLLLGIIQAVWAAYEIEPVTDVALAATDVIFLGRYLQALTWQVSTEEKSLYIFLDSLDLLAPIEQAHRLAWLPVDLPKHCSLIISMAPENSGCLDSARQVIDDDSKFIKIPPLAWTAADKVISSTMNRQGRTITCPQRALLLEQFRGCPTPLYLTLIINQALLWRSHQQVKDLVIGSDTNLTINYFLLTIERQYGMTLVSKGFGLMTSMMHGITLREVEDLLSLDNEVLRDTYIYHLPPDPDNIRIPTGIWTRVVTDLKQYLHYSDSEMTVEWNNRAFVEVAKERYLLEDRGKAAHRLAAQYYLEYWYNRVKPLRLDKGKVAWYPDSIRKISKQPLRFTGEKWNLRKLGELPRHLAKAGMWREFHKEIVCNVEWLVAKIASFGASELKADLMMLLKQRNNLSEKMEVDVEDHPPKGEGEEELKKEEKKEEVQVEENKDENKPRNEDEDLFLTENKKQNAEAERKEEEEEVPEEVVQEEEYVPDLATALKDTEIMLEIVSRGIEALRVCANNLPVQIICHLGQNRASSPGLCKLVKDCYEWVRDNSRPMFQLQDACMPTPGEMLQSTLSVDLYFPDSDRDADKPAQMSRDDDYFYVVQQSMTSTDKLLVLDLGQGGEMVTITDMKCYIHSLRLNGNKRFIIVSAYKSLEEYNPTFVYYLYERSFLFPYQLEKEALSMDVSYQGDIVAYADEKTCYICSPKREEKMLEIIYRLHHTDPITNIMFSPDAYFLITFMPGDAFKVWVPRRGDLTLSVEGKSQNRFSLTERSGKVAHITANQKLILALAESTKKNTAVIYDLSSGSVLHELCSSELSHNYEISNLELDKGEEYLLVSTAESSIINGSRAKSALLWDIEKGSLVSCISSEKAVVATKVLVINYIIYLLAAFDKDPAIYVYNVGKTHRPLAGAKLIRTIRSHNKFVMQLILSMSEDEAAVNNHLMSIGADNTVKIWDLNQLLTPEPKVKKEEMGGTTCLSHSRDGLYVIFATDKGYIVRQNCGSSERVTIASELGGPVHLLLISKKGKYVIAAVRNVIYIYEIESGKLAFTFNSCDSTPITCMAENNNVLIAGHAGMEGKGRLWDLATGQVMKDVSFLYAFYQAAVNDHGTQYGVTMFEYPLMMNVFETGEKEKAISMEQVDSVMSPCTKLEFSPNGNMLASASRDGRLRVISTETGRYLHAMVQGSTVHAMLFSMDCRYLYTAGYRSVFKWCVGSDHCPEMLGQLEVKITKHKDYITNMSLLNDEKYLLTGSLDKTIVLLSMKTRSTICTFYASLPIEIMSVASDLSSIAFVPDRSANAALLTLNKAAHNALGGIPKVPVPPKVKKAQAVALVFSSQQVTQKTSVACTIL